MEAPTATETRVPSPDIVKESPAPQLPAEIEVVHERIRQRQEQHPNVPAAFLSDQPFGEVVGAIAAVMADLHPVEKGGTNSFHNYKYARMQDILQMLTPLMGKHGLVVFQYERRHQMFDDGKVMAISYDFVVAHKSGQTWLNPVPQTGMSPCRTSKGTFDDKATAKCHTSARKYFLLSLFQIPTEDESDDPDNEKRGRDTPVPGPGGYTPPHRIDPVKGETPKTWSTKFRNAIQAARSDAELLEWDSLNDDLLQSLSDKAEDIYGDVLKKFEGLRAKFAQDGKIVHQTAPAVHQEAPQTHQTTNSVHDTTDPSFYDKTRAEVRQEAKAAAERPADCPNPEKDPDGFITWATKRMAAITTAEELDLVFEQVIDPAADGMMPPDYSAVQAEYEANKKRLGGD